MRKEVNIITGEVIELPDRPATPEGDIFDFDQLDQETLNRLLADEGSIVRAILEIQFGMIKGTIPINPNITLPIYRALVRSKMRTPK
jgi:hypothetical protein